ncbi:MAG: Lrp/AsnC family transcriptional regulator [Paracoccaceae bacterium]
MDRLDPINVRLLDEFQRDLPLIPRPFAEIGTVLGLSEAEVIYRLAGMQAAGSIARVGATVRPNTVGASTLAALAVPEDRIEAVAALVGQEPGVNHSYLREHDWNLWFVATAPDAAALAASLARIGARTGLKVLDLPLVQPFNIDLGFRLSGAREAGRGDRPADMAALREGDRPILQAMAQGLALVPRPFAAIAQALGRAEGDVLARLVALSAAGICTRIGVIVRHRAIGWRANAMVVWDVPEGRIAAAGAALAAHPGVTLCYQRRVVPGVWRYGLFSMIHGQSRAQAVAVLAAAAALPELAGVAHQPLFSTRCFKQTGALVHEVAA